MKLKLLSIIGIVSISTLYSCNTNAQKGTDGLDGISLFNDFSLQPEEGKGPLTNKEYQFDFDGINASSSLRVEILKSNVEKIVVNAPTDIIDKIEIRKEGNNAWIGIAKGVRNLSTNKVKVTVYAKDFNRLSASSSSIINVHDIFKDKNLEISSTSSARITGVFENENIDIKTSSSADFSGEVKTKQLILSSSSSSTISLRGYADVTKAQATSSASIRATDFMTKSATLEGSSSAGIQMGVSESLVGNASSSANIFVKKMGKLRDVKINESSSGSVSVK